VCFQYTKVCSPSNVANCPLCLTEHVRQAGRQAVENSVGQLDKSFSGWPEDTFGLGFTRPISQVAPTLSMSLLYSTMIQ